MKGSEKQRIQPARADDFKSIARRLECVSDIGDFDAKLKKIASNAKLVEVGKKREA